MGLAEVHGFSHMFCSKLDIGLGPEITFVLYYETRLGGGASGEGKKKLDVGDRAQGIREHQQESDWPLWRQDQGLRVAEGRERTAKCSEPLSRLSAGEIETLENEWVIFLDTHLLGPGAHLWDHIVAWVWEFIAVGQYALGLHPGIMRKVRAVWHYLFSTLRMLAVLYSPSSFSYSLSPFFLLSL